MELFDFLHRQLQPDNPYCRAGRPRWKACRVAISDLLKSGALLSIIAQLDAQQSPSPPRRIEDEEALAPKAKRGRPRLLSGVSFAALGQRLYMVGCPAVPVPCVHTAPGPHTLHPLARLLRPRAR